MGVAKASLEKAGSGHLGLKRESAVHCISAGPVNTLAARGHWRLQLHAEAIEAHAPLKRNVLPKNWAPPSLFLASDGAAAITGQVLYVDCGYQIMGM